MTKKVNDLIRKIRLSIKEHSNSAYFGDMDDTKELVEQLRDSNEVDVEIIADYTEDRGDRWTHWEICIYKINLNGQDIFFQVEEEDGKTESQYVDGCVVVKEVIPKEIKTIQYFDVTDKSEDKEEIQDCKYCRGNVDNRDYLMSDGNNGIYISGTGHLVGDDELCFEDKKIKYCPECGRKL